jgi:hypothetical protein
MRAFLLSLAAAIVIAVVAALVLGNLGLSSADVFQAEQGNVRL